MSMEGKRVPSVTFRSKRKSISLTEITSERLFNGKKVILFALPGAFTPTCSTQQLPRYEQLAKLFKENGIDDIICLSVNDPFVMETWGDFLGVEEVRLLSDGNGEFTKEMGMIFDMTGASLGIRSLRYSMYVEDGTIKKVFLEAGNSGTDLTVSDADTMYKYLFPTKPKLRNVTMMVLPGCPDCAKMKMLFDTHKMPYSELRYGHEINGTELFSIAGAKRFPQIFIDGQHIDPDIYMDGNRLKASGDLYEKIMGSLRV